MCETIGTISNFIAKFQSINSFEKTAFDVRNLLVFVGFRGLLHCQETVNVSKRTFFFRLPVSAAIILLLGIMSTVVICHASQQGTIIRPTDCLVDAQIRCTQQLELQYMTKAFRHERKRKKRFQEQKG